MSSNADIEELRKVVTTEINRVTGVEVLPIYNNPTAVENILEAVEKFTQQKVIEAQRNVAQRIALDGNPGYAATRLAAELQAQLNHNKKGDNNE